MCAVGALGSAFLHAHRPVWCQVAGAPRWIDRDEMTCIASPHRPFVTPTALPRALPPARAPSVVHRSFGRAVFAGPSFSGPGALMFHLQPRIGRRMHALLARLPFSQSQSQSQAVPYERQFPRDVPAVARLLAAAGIRVRVPLHLHCMHGHDRTSCTTRSRPVCVHIL